MEDRETERQAHVKRSQLRRLCWQKNSHHISAVLINSGDGITILKLSSPKSLEEKHRMKPSSILTAKVTLNVDLKDAPSPDAAGTLAFNLHKSHKLTPQSISGKKKHF